MTLFHRLSKHLEFLQKYSAVHRIFNSLICVWISWWNIVSHVWFNYYICTVTSHHLAHKDQFLVPGSGLQIWPCRPQMNQLSVLINLCVRVSKSLWECTRVSGQTRVRVCELLLTPVLFLECVSTKVKIYHHSFPLHTVSHVLIWPTIMVKSPWDTRHVTIVTWQLRVVLHQNDIFNASPLLPRQCWNASSTLATRIQHCLGGQGGTWLKNMGSLLKTGLKYLKTTNCPKTFVHDCSSHESPVAQ